MYFKLKVKNKMEFEIERNYVENCKYVKDLEAVINNYLKHQGTYIAYSNQLEHYDVIGLNYILLTLAIKLFEEKTTRNLQVKVLHNLKYLETELLSMCKSKQDFAKFFIHRNKLSMSLGLTAARSDNMKVLYNYAKLCTKSNFVNFNIGYRPTYASSYLTSANAPQLDVLAFELEFGSNNPVVRYYIDTVLKDTNTEIKLKSGDIEIQHTKNLLKVIKRLQK